MPITAIALGSNLGDREANLRDALTRLAALGTVAAVSSFHDTTPVGYLDQPRFLNAAALLETDLQPLALLHALLGIEQAMGRDRATAPLKGPRIIDLDLLLFGDLTGANAELTLPHPAMHERAFVLAPLAEIAPQMQHPGFHRTIAELLAAQAGSQATDPQRKQCRGLFWTFTAVGVLMAATLVWVLYAMVAALAAFAAGIAPIAYYILFGSGALGVLSLIVALRTSRTLRSRTERRFGLAVNALPMLVYLLLLGGIVLLTFKTQRRRFILPDRYQGDVTVLHVPRGSIPGAKGWWRTTYTIPPDGILVTSDAEPPGFASDEYDYALPRGRLRKIRDFDPGTMPDTPQNRTNDRDFGAYFPHSGSSSDSEGCTVEDEQIYIGTSAWLLSYYKPADLEAYMHAHPEVCIPGNGMVVHLPPASPR